MKKRKKMITIPLLGGGVLPVAMIANLMIAILMIAILMTPKMLGREGKDTYISDEEFRQFTNLKIKIIYFFIYSKILCAMPLFLPLPLVIMSFLSCTVCVGKKYMS